MDKSLHSTGVRAFGRFRLDPVRRVLLRDGVPVTLSPKLLEMLIYLVENPGRVVEKDELMNAVWPGRFVEENNISQTVFHLRKALGDSGEEDRLIATAPGHGYRFCAPVEVEHRADAVSEVVAPPPAGTADAAKPVSGAVWRRFAYSTSTGALLLVGLALGFVIYAPGFRRTQQSATPNTVVVADFQNLTNDPTLGTVLGKVLEIDLAQSPFLSLLSPTQVRQTLRLMERPESARLTLDLAQEVCVRNQDKAVLSGAVAALGSRYIVTLEAKDCDSGKNIAEGKAEAGRKEDVPNALDGLSARMRESLNESLASIRRFNVPIAQATTSSFEALTDFSLGERTRAQDDNTTSIPLFKRAIELDPAFALAYEELGADYMNLRESELGKTYYRKAFDLKDRVSEIERLRITANYYQLAGNYAESVRSYRTWTQIYPRDWLPWTNLSNLYTRMSRYRDAIEAGKEALLLNPQQGTPYIVLTRAYKRSTRFDDAKSVAKQTIAKGLDGWQMHTLLYEIAFVEGDAATMAEQIAREKDKPTECWMLEYEAWAAATEGKVRQSRVLFEKAIAAARAQGADASEDVSGFYTDYIEMVADFGLKREAQELASKAPGMDVDDDAPFAFAKAGDLERAATLAAALGKRYPVSTSVNDIYRPLTVAEIDLQLGKPAAAIAALQPALPFELQDFEAPSLLGQAYLDTRAPDRAAAEYRKILANRGVDGLSPLYPLAWLGLARALHMQGKLRECRLAYDKLFAFWKDADGDLPVLQEAKAEYAKL